MNTILPPQYRNGKKYKPDITTGSDGIRQDFHAPRSGRENHGGIDINYQHESGSPVGQNGINKEHPSVHSPVSGTVTYKKPEWGMIEISDENGFKHQIMHLDKIDVKEKDRIIAGQKIGTMGGRGPKGPNEYAQHVHYTIKSPDGKTDPEAHWNSPGKKSSSSFPWQTKTDFKHVSVLDHATQYRLKSLLRGINIVNGETLRREGDKVWRIEPDGSTRGYFISP